MSPERGATHHAPVRLPPALPVEVQRIVGPEIRICPCGPTPVRVPSKFTSALRDAIGSLSGQGWPGEQVPSSSRAAMPDNRSLGPSAHQTGPSPSQTWVGVQAKVSPVGIAAACSAKSNGPIIINAAYHHLHPKRQALPHGAVCNARGTRQLEVLWWPDPPNRGQRQNIGQFGLCSLRAALPSPAAENARNQSDNPTERRVIRRYKSPFEASTPNTVKP